MHGEDRTICFCYSVMESEIMQAIEEGAHSLLEIRKKTYANTGCGGCSQDIQDLLAKYKAQQDQK